MKYIKLNTTDPYYNLAVEEYLFSNTREDVFMLWQNSPTVVIGKNQNAYAEVDIDYARTNRINICRRITGGGAVYHDSGNVNYSYISSTDRVASLDFDTPSRAIISALEDMGIAAELSGRNDILVNEKKISGNAQHTSNGRLLHHGTLLFDTDTGEMERVLKVDKEKLEHNGVKSHKSRVANIKDLLPTEMTCAEFIRALEVSVKDFLCAEDITVPDCHEISSLYDRNKSSEWIFSDKKHLTSVSLTKKKRFSCGTVCARIVLERDTIKNISLTGDFFTKRPIEKLEKLIMEQNLSAFDVPHVSDYIVGMTDEELKDIILK